MPLCACGFLVCASEPKSVQRCYLKYCSTYRKNISQFVIFCPMYGLTNGNSKKLWGYEKKCFLLQIMLEKITGFLFCFTDQFNLS